MIHVRFAQVFPLRVAEWFASGAMATWGVIVLSHPEVLEAGEAWRGLLTIAPGPFWGWAALLSGVIGWTALAINGALRRTPHVRAVCAAMRCAVWLMVTTGLLMSGQLTTALAMYPWALALDVYNVYRASGDARTSDEGYKGSV